MPSKGLKKIGSLDELIIATAIAVVCAFALVVFAARQTPADGRSAVRAGMTREQINAAEERAIWASPKGTTASSGPTVTMTGCIEKRGDSFRLTDTEGDEAPRARSWKFGFIRRGTVPLDLVDGAQTAPFRHVGERVLVTGTLDDRELTLRSLRRVTDSCS
jgi:hypothetical protein